MPITFTLKKNPTFKLDCSQLTPDKLAKLSLDKILEITLTSNIKVADLFEVTGESVEHLIFKNCSSQLDYIGHNMLTGNITIEGDCGDFLGANMRGGTIVCQGNAGDRVGDQMRRGLILIDSNAGDYVASRMLAGTIGVHGKLGKHAGFGMKRGTLLLSQPPNLHATIQDCGTHNLPFLKLLFNAFKLFNSKFSSINSTRVRRYCGDIACNGNGEILVLE